MFTNTFPMSFTGSYAEEEPNFHRQNNLILQKMVAGEDKVVNFKDSSRPNKEIKYFSRTLIEFKDFSRQLHVVNFKTLSRLYEVWSNSCDMKVWLGEHDILLLFIWLFFQSPKNRTEREISHWLTVLVSHGTAPVETAQELCGQLFNKMWKRTAHQLNVQAGCSSYWTVLKENY